MSANMSVNRTIHTTTNLVFHHGVGKPAPFLLKMWNLNNRKDILLKYNLVRHPLRNKSIWFDGNKYTILNVYKKWNSGWYISVEIDYNKDYYVELPLKNINSDNPAILELIENVQQRTKMGE